MFTTHTRVLCVSALLLLIGLFSGQAQELRTRQDYIQAALEHNPELRAAASRVTSAQAARKRASAWEAPTVAFEFYSTPITSFNPLRDGLENDYSIQQMIHLPGKIGSMEAMADAGIGMRRQNVETARLSLIAEVKAAYAMLATAQRRMSVNDENFALLEQISQSISAAYAVGRGSNADIQRVHAELELLRNDATTIASEARRAAAMLQALIGRDQYSGPVKVEELRIVPFTWSLDSLVELAETARPELRAMNLDIEMQEARTNLARREWLPDIMVRAMYKEMTMGMPDYWSLMFGVSVPFAPWASGRYSGAVEEAAADSRAASETLENMRRMTGFEVRDAWEKAHALWERSERYRDSIIPFTEQALQSAMNAYGTGGGDFTTLLDSARMLAMLRMDAEMLTGDYHTALARLERAAGVDLGI